MRFFARHQAYALAMAGTGEHVAGSYFFYGIIVFGEKLEVACEGGGIAADVDDPVGGHLRDRTDQLRGQSLAGRVDDNHIGGDPLFAKLFGCL